LYAHLLATLREILLRFVLLSHSASHSTRFSFPHNSFPMNMNRLPSVKYVATAATSSFPTGVTLEYVIHLVTLNSLLREERPSPLSSVLTVRTVSREFLSSLLHWLTDRPQEEREGTVGVFSALHYALEMGCIGHLTTSIDETPGDHFQVCSLPSLPPSRPSLTLSLSSQSLENLFSLVTTLLQQSSSSCASSCFSSSSLQARLLSHLMSYALRSIQAEIHTKTCLALDSISSLLSSNQSSSDSIIQLLLQPQPQEDEGHRDICPLLSALQAVLTARSLQKESNSRVFETICSIIERALSTQLSSSAPASLHLEILCLCGVSSSYLVEDLVTVVYTALLHCPDSSPCWNLPSLAPQDPLHAAWTTILSVILSLPFSSASSTKLPAISVFKAGWILSLIVNKVTLPLLFSCPLSDLCLP
jgi:hypothetical protein